jgi:hypothetical protein
MGGETRKRHNQRPGDLKETRGYRKFKEEVLDSTGWRTHFARGYGPAVRLNE